MSRFGLLCSSPFPASLLSCCLRQSEGPVSYSKVAEIRNGHSAQRMDTTHHPGCTNTGIFIGSMNSNSHRNTDKLGFPGLQKLKGRPQVWWLYLRSTSLQNKKPTRNVRFNFSCVDLSTVITSGLQFPLCYMTGWCSLRTSRLRESAPEDITDFFLHLFFS
jgi:hypothetical protein